MFFDQPMRGVDLNKYLLISLWLPNNQSINLYVHVFEYISFHSLYAYVYVCMILFHSTLYHFIVYMQMLTCT